MNYGTLAAPLTQLLKKDAFEWTKQATDAFEKLKTTMVIMPVLALPDFNLPFVIETDASDTGLGAVLTQVQRPIAYFSHTLSHQGQAKSVISMN